MKAGPPAVEQKAGQKQQDVSTVEDGVVPAAAPGLKVNHNPNWLSRGLFLFVDPLVSYGYKQTLQPGDLYKPLQVNTKPLYESFSRAWGTQRKRPVPDLKRTVLVGRTWGLVYTGILYAVSLASQLVGPLMLQQIVGGLSCYAAQEANPAIPCPTRSYLYLFVIGLCLAPLVQSLAENAMQFELNMIGTQMRNGLMAAIFRKCLVLSNTALQSESTGRIVTLMSNDAQKVQDAMLAIHVLWGAPVLIVVILVLLYLQVGWATFVGLGVMVLFAPISTLVSRRLLRIRRAILVWTDKRVGLMSEIINGMQMIKFYAWEEPFRKEVMAARANEAQLLKDSTWWMALFGMLLFSGPVMVAVFCFGAYALAGQPLSTAGAYTALALFNLLRFPLAFLPFLITMLVNAAVALRRIQGFLEKGETTAVVDTESVEPGVVKVTDAEFNWDEGSEKPTLRDISFECPPGSLTMVVGNVGCGKSSVLAGLIGQIERRKGSVAVGGKVAYVAQTAWIINDIVQENVMLGEAFDPERYRMAVEVAQLVPDLEILPNGDRTEIGDRGVTLSGGQKQRVSIARAVYADADVYLMDDPLSAVDSHVGRALFEECITGVLAGKTVVLVTNALQFLPHADNIVWLEDGAIRAQGTYSQLVEQGLNIAELVHVEDEVKQARANEDAKEQHAADAEGRAVVKEVDVHGVVVPGGRGSTDGSSSSTSADAVAAVDDEAVAEAVAKRRAARKAEASTMGRWQAEGKPSAALTLTHVNLESNRNLTGVEMREEGNVSSNVIKTYTKAGGGKWIFVLIVLLFVFEQGSRVFTDTWVGIWFGNAFNQSVGFYLGIYVLLSVLYALATFLRSLRFLYTLVNAAISLHNQLLHHVLRLPKAFFDTNPAGRILNRFSRDTEVMDSVLSQSLIQFAGSLATYIAILIVISVATKWFAIAIIPMTIFYFFLQRYYIPSARELQRIESVTRSPIYSKFSEALAGVATIRAYRKETYFTNMSDDLMQGNAYAYMSQKAAASWLAMRLDFVGLIILTLAGVLCIQGTISPGLAGLCLTYALDLTRFLKQGTAMASKTESDFNSAERIVQYLQPEPEASPDTKPEVAKTLPPNWPAAGAVSVRNVTMRYRPEMPLVLKGVTFELGAGEKVGLVGRTGSGKSSLFQVLFRMVEPTSGIIAIDGVDITTLGLHLLRSKMSIIPQDPFLFSGTVRYNLDPFNEHTDAALWEVLLAVGLKPTISALELKLEAPVTDSGNNFSQGQKQLFCMARAMLRHSRILMLDEATASVDPETDALIQTAIRSVFHDCTVLTIAHRLNTIMDSDRVLVMDNGVVAEDDTPHNLLQRDAGQFTSMVAQTGTSSSTHLRQVARTASRSRGGMLQHVDSNNDRRWGSSGGGSAVDGDDGEVAGPKAALRTPSQLGVPRELLTHQDPNTTLTSAPTNLNREIRLMRQNMASGDLDLNPLGMVREGSAEGNSSSGTLGTAISGALNAISRISRRSIGSLDMTPGGRGSGSLDAPAGRHSPANMAGSGEGRPGGQSTDSNQ